MLYYLYLLEEYWSALRVFRYITVRAVLGAGTAFLLCVCLGPWVIEQLRRLKVGQYVRKDEAPPLYQYHGQKAGTPTMGGLLIIGSMTLSTLLWADPGNVAVWLVISTLVVMGGIGFVDDYLKVVRKQSKGLSARGKFAMQSGWALLVGALMLMIPETREGARQLMVPFLKEPLIADMGVIGSLFFIGLVLVGASNAVNLTDGLDGLAIGCSSSVAITYLVMAYAAGHQVFARYLHIPYVPSGGELAVLCGCLAGACLGFLWYNCHPARVFMGDTGSLALGGAIGMIALLIKQEVVLVLVGGVFVIEAVSVILQVASFKLRGKRIFAMAPLHHHFEMKKWSETQVTIRFWILSIICALLGLLTLKMR
ncbi:MAG: phospho-N-acetylmuramoyl-pentapeptide-transferase [Verrucomicrobia bacterium]|nr:phospho-N-acetylmuramoyl-pentapeptide-transferase [Verrucomicrobiota bacterium]